ncbi:MAG TPA: choline dehydrogenase [Blastocatellia bacterium]|nr:choline dehydrogenase [Blastocatellia bacterium]
MYDYVIIGAGSAGCVLASRLTEDPDAKVLLLEAGGPANRQEINIPAAFSKLFKGPCDWAYYTEEQPHLNNRRLFWPRGKVLGGSSSINAMIYIRGNRRDYDRWSETCGEEWSFAKVLPYFKKSENQERGASEYHGTGGPLNVADLRYRNPLSRAFVEGCLEAGIPASDDFNGPEQDGAGFYQVTQKGGKRHSAADAYLKPALKRPNLKVETFAHTTRVLFDGTRAVGAEYVKDAKTVQVRATREVILSGGAINSPQLLMLSGVGPADHLREMGISVVADLPGVGRNLQDHLLGLVAYESVKPVSLASAEKFGNLMSYLLFKQGPLASNIAEAGGFLKTGEGISAPDLQFHFGPVYYIEHGFVRPEGHGFSIGPTLLRPESRGSILLRSADPLSPPLIQPGYLASEADMRVLVEGVRLGRAIAGTKAFAPFRGKEVYPGPQASTDEAISEYLRNIIQSIYHPVGTCKMGRGPDAVVDARLRVRGVEGLRVVDASVMPDIVGGNTNAPTIMIAEKAADFIRGAS